MKKLLLVVCLIAGFDYFTGTGGLFELAYAQGNDVNLGSQFTSFTTVVRGAAWSSINNAYIFAPNSQDASMCLEVINNNPSSSHTLTIGLNQTHDPNTTTYTGNLSRWVATQTVTPLPITVPAATGKGIYFQTFGAAQLALVFTGASTQAGNPDTVDIFIVATKQGNCGIGPGGPIAVQGPIVQGTSLAPAAQIPVLVGGMTAPGSTSTLTPFFVDSNGAFEESASACCASVLGNNFFAASSSANVPKAIAGGINQMSLQSVCPVASFGTVTTVRVLCGYTRNSLREEATDVSSITGGSMPAWMISGRVTNPGANTLVLLDSLSTASTVSAQYDTLTLGCSAACELQVVKITSLGTTCTAVTPAPLNVWGSTQPAFNAAHVALQGTCAAQPATTGGVMFDVFLQASQSIQLDIRGLTNVRQVTQLTGWAVFNVSSLTGIATASAAVVED